MFSIANNLGNNSKSYTPDYLKTTDISFAPIKNPAGNVNYIAVIDTEDDRIPETEFTKLYREGEIYKKPAQQQECASPDSDPFYIGDDPIKIFYVGSLTAVGLYILYRILTKGR